MGDKTQQRATDEPKQATSEGLEIPVLKRSEVIDAFKKVLRPKPKDETRDLLDEAASRPLV